jgi:hypothetical protein
MTRDWAVAQYTDDADRRRIAVHHAELEFPEHLFGDRRMAIGAATRSLPNGSPQTICAVGRQRRVHAFPVPGQASWHCQLHFVQSTGAFVRRLHPGQDTVRKRREPSAADLPAAAMTCRKVLPAARRIPQKAGRSSARDSLTGIVAVTGTSFEKRLVLRSGQRSTTLTANPSDSASLTRVSGTEVRVRGQANSDAFLVSSFTVVSVDTRPVVDGVLRNDGANVLLETAHGPMSLGNPPSALRARGARVDRWARRRP